MLAKIFSGLDWRHWVLTHLVWVAAITVALVMGHSYLAEHDARIAADAQIKAAEVTVANLQQQIVATNAAAAQKVQVVTKIVHDVQTVPQAVAAIPQLTDVPLHTRVTPDNPTQVSVDALPLVQVLGECKVAETNLNACQADLKNETAIAAAKDTEIKALKKKPAFWKRVKKTLEIIAICVSIGAALGHGI